MIKSQKISHAAFYLVIIGIVSTFLGFLRELFLAYKFGVSATTDSFLVAIVPISLLVYFAKSADVTFVSRFSKGLIKDGKKAWLSASRIINVTIIFVAGLALAFLFFAPFLTKLLAPGFSPDNLNLVSSLIRITVPAILTIPLFIFIKGILNSHKHFTWPEIAALFPNLGVIFGILVLSATLGIKGAVIGLVIGYILQALIPGIKILPFFFKNYSFSVSTKDPEVRKFFLYSFFLILILIGLNIDTVADKIFGSYLPIGSIAALNYARRITASAYYLIAYALATTLLPVLSQANAIGDEKKFKEHFKIGLEMLIFILLPLSILIFILREPILIVLFKHGVFGSHDLSLTSSVLAIYSLGIIALAGITFLARVFYSLDDIKIPAIIGIFTMVINVILDFILIKYFSFKGLALATLIAANLNFIALLIYLWLRSKAFKMKSLLIFLFKTLVALTFVLVIIFSIFPYLKSIQTNEFLKSIIEIIVISGLEVTIFLIVSYILKIEPLFHLKDFLYNLIGKINETRN